jgi:hypothetical protein
MEELTRLLADGGDDLGWEWPVEQTAIPAAKSRKRLPSTSVTIIPAPDSATSG